MDDQSWKMETEQYADRLSDLLALDPSYTSAIDELWPDKVWPSPSDFPDGMRIDKFIAFRIATFCTGIVGHSLAVTKLVVDLWRSGQFFAVPLNTRYVYESWATVHFAARILKESDESKALEISERLLHGVKAEVFLPWGQRATEKAINIMEYIRSLQDVDPDAEDLYAFLSAAAHPNNLQNSYFAMMGPPLSNWGNPKFKEIGHPLLEKTLAAHETANTSMQSESAAVLHQAASILKLKSRGRPN